MRKWVQKNCLRGRYTKLLAISKTGNHMSVLLGSSLKARACMCSTSKVANRP